MPCRPFSRDGYSGFLCGPKVRVPKCKCGSGQLAELMCDWKVGEAGATCDAKICRVCSTVPAPLKDLCPAHAEAWKLWKGAKA